MKNKPSSRSFARGGFTLLELLIALSISSLFVGLALATFVQSERILRVNTDEAQVCERGSSLIRRLSQDLRAATQVTVYSDYQHLAAGEQDYGSCIIIEGVSTNAYYFDSSNESVYYKPAWSGSLSPAVDRKLMEQVQDIEFRWNPNGALRIGLEAGFRGLHETEIGASEKDRVRFSTSIAMRNQ